MEELILAHSQTMGICPIRCRSNMSILENASESSAPGTNLFITSPTLIIRNVVKMQQMTGFVSAAPEDAIIVSLCNHPAFGQIDPTMCLGERLTVLSEWVTPVSVFHLLHRDDLHDLTAAFFFPPSTVTATF